MALEGDKRILLIAFLVSLTVSLAVNLIYIYGGQLWGNCNDKCPFVIQEDVGRGPAGALPNGPVPAALPNGPAGALPNGPVPGALPNRPDPGAFPNGPVPGKQAGALPATGMQNRWHGGESGGFGMRPSATPEILALYKERAELYGKYAGIVTMAFNAAGKDSMDVLKACLARDKARLAYWRRKADMRQMTGAAEAFLQYKAAEKVQKYTDEMFKAGTIDQDKLNLAISDFIDAKIQLKEALLRIQDKTAWEKAVKPLENYPDNVTDELLRNLLLLETSRSPR